MKIGSTVSVRSFSGAVKLQLNNNSKKQIEPTLYKSFAQYRLKLSQHDPLNLLNRSKHLHKPDVVKMDIKEEYFSFDKSFKDIARSIEYKEKKFSQ